MNPLKYHFSGPPLDKGPLPALFYFALSGKESLFQDPFNQPVVALEKRLIRVFSFSLPCHGPGLKNTEAMSRWAEEIRSGNDIFGPFIDQCLDHINRLVSENVIDPKKIAVAGLSRGGFIAAHLAAREPRINRLLAFAPMTSLAVLQEFSEILDSPIASSYDLFPLLPNLIKKRVRFYIGNLDTRVGTKESFNFIYNLAREAKKGGVRSPQIELIISASIGHKGHGTSREVFEAGASWVANGW